MMVWYGRLPPWGDAVSVRQTCGEREGHLERVGVPGGEVEVAPAVLEREAAALRDSCGAMTVKVLDGLVWELCLTSGAEACRTESR